MGGHVNRRMRSCLCGPSLQAVGRLAEKRISYIDPHNLGLLSVVKDYWSEQTRCFWKLLILMALEEPVTPTPPFSEEQISWIEGLVKKVAEADKGADKAGTF